MRLDARLRRLEVKTERQPVVFKVVWDDDDDQEPAAGRVIRLRWGDDREAVETRLRRLEVRRQRRMIAAVAADMGLTADELLEEAEAFFTLALEEQLAQVDAIAEEPQAEGLSTDDLDDLKDTLRQEYKP